MRQFEVRNQHFDRLFNTPDLMWLGQNTNHFPTHPAVTQAMVDCIRSEEFHAYAPPAGMEELRQLILALLGDGVERGVVGVLGALHPGHWAKPAARARLAARQRCTITGMATAAVMPATGPISVRAISARDFPPRC